jgi:hypothetical protein
MPNQTQEGSLSFDETCRRFRRNGQPAGASLRFAGIVVVAVAGLFALAPAAGALPAGSAVVFTHSAKSGELGGGRLTLHGVRRQVTWASNGGRFGMASVRRMHGVLFSPGITSATGTLHVGQRRGDALTFRLSRPRYNASRRTVSYRAKPLRRGARMPRRFGAASLSLLDAPQVSRPLNASCNTSVTNGTKSDLKVTKADQQSSDSWAGSGDPQGSVAHPLGALSWASNGGGLDWDHCYTDITVQVVGTATTFDVYTVRGANGFSINRCTPNDSGSPYSCQGNNPFTIIGG